MRYIREVLRDRRRAQRGSVLSAVLIITAFVAILSAALTTELSTNLILSHNLMLRVGKQATVDSALELALSELQTVPIASGCPTLGTATVNGRSASATYLACAPTVRTGEQQLIRLVTSSAFNLDGVHAVIPAAGGLNDYVVGDSGGVLHDFGFGNTSASWTFSLGGSVTATPLVMLDPTGPPDISTLVPVSNPTANGGCPGGSCVALLNATGPGTKPALTCYVATSGPVVSTPAEGRSYNHLVFFGDSAGKIFATDATEDGACAVLASSPGQGRPVVGTVLVYTGPVAKKVPSDTVYAVASDGTGSELDAYSYTVDRFAGPMLTFSGSVPLPAPNATGLAADQANLPAQVAVTFAGGQVAMVDISSAWSMSVTASTALPTGVRDAPGWGGAGVIAVGGQNGAMYLLGSSLNVLAATPAGSPAIRTTPQADGQGDWFFGADDGYVYEAQQAPGQSSLAVVDRFGQANGAVGSGVQVAGCPSGLCAYFASSSGAAYIIKLDARNAIISACITVAPPACSGDNPRLWASVQVGAAGSPQTVHVQGWSYYSP